jgi:hypothetical protein
LRLGKGMGVAGTHSVALGVVKIGMFPEGPRLWRRCWAESGCYTHGLFCPRRRERKLKWPRTSPRMLAPVSDKHLAGKKMLSEPASSSST